MHAIQKHTPTSRDRRIRPTTPPLPTSTVDGARGATRRGATAAAATLRRARTRSTDAHDVYPHGEMRRRDPGRGDAQERARAARERCVERARARGRTRAHDRARRGNDGTRARGVERGGGVGGEYRRARWARERRVARVERAARGRAMRGVGCADETLKPERSRAGERSERVGRGRPLRGRVDARGESDETVKATLRWWIRWETRR